MRSSYLIPKKARFLPSKSDRLQAEEIVKNNTVDKFENIQDWFFFMHINPVQRYVHSFGMLAGLPFYLMTVLAILNKDFISSLIYLIIATFFFHFVGVLAHIIYDNGQGQTVPKNFIAVFLTIIKINFKTITGTYDKELRRFVHKYPFTMLEHELIEIPRNRIIDHLFLREETQIEPHQSVVDKELEF